MMVIALVTVMVIMEGMAMMVMGKLMSAKTRRRCKRDDGDEEETMGWE